MNLIQRIIVWLAARFLTKTQHIDLFNAKVFTPGNEAEDLRTVFHRYASLHQQRAGNLNKTALTHLYKVFGVADLFRLVLFKAIQQEVTYCPSGDCNELDELLKKLTDVKETNPLKRLSLIKGILRQAMPGLDPNEIAILAQVATTVVFADTKTFIHSLSKDV